MTTPLWRKAELKHSSFLFYVSVEWRVICFPLTNQVLVACERTSLSHQRSDQNNLAGKGSDIIFGGETLYVGRYVDT